MRKSCTLIAAALTAATLPLTAMADKPDWRYVEGGYTKMDFDDNESFEPDGLTVNGKYLLNSNWYLTASIASLKRATDFDMCTGCKLPFTC